VVPFADQYVVAGSRSHLNRFISHPPCPGVVEPALAAIGLQDRLLLLNSGQSYDFDAARKSPDAPYRHFRESDREEYIRQSLRDKEYEHEKLSFAPVVALERLVGYARDRLWSIQQRKAYRPQYSLYIDAQDQRRRFHVRLDRADMRQVPWDAPLEEPYLRVGCNATLLIMLLLGHVSWNIADAALFLDYERAPNDYHPEVYVCLNQLKA
jgi:UDP-MurNAc hydroxylase